MSSTLAKLVMVSRGDVLPSIFDRRGSKKEALTVQGGLGKIIDVERNGLCFLGV